MKKIGVISLFHESCNYGGVLQAYAFIYYLRKLGYIAEQIDYNDKILTFSQKLKRLIKVLLLKQNYHTKEIHSSMEAFVEQRRHVFKKFRDEFVPHSSEFNQRTLFKLNNMYDVFVCGSDQIWNHYFDEAFFLGFVKGKKKIAYAASMSHRKMSNKLSRWIFKRLRDFDAVSVREENLIPFLSQSKKNISWVVDPTLLLSCDEWRAFAQRDVVCDSPYLLCYFLGSDDRLRKIAQEYAQRNHLKIVTFPFMNDDCYYVDENFGDIRLFDASPRRFVGLIQDAKYVMTDSFHVTVFSNILKKQFFTFSRVGKKEADGRMKNLLKIFENEIRFVDDPCVTIDYIESLEDVNYDTMSPLFEEMLKKSKDFIQKNI